MPDNAPDSMANTKPQLGPGKLAELATALDGLVHKITAGLHKALIIPHHQFHAIIFSFHFLLSSFNIMSMYLPATTNPSAVQDQRDLDAVEREALNQPMGTHLHQIAERARGFIDRELRPGTPMSSILALPACLLLLFCERANVMIQAKH